MRLPITLLLTLSLLVQSLPLRALAEEVPVEPVVETPTEQTVTDEVVSEETVEEPTKTADDSQTVVQEEPNYFSIAETIDLPNGCEITDASGATHLFPTATTTQYLAACALAIALDTEIIDEITVTDSSFGPYVSSINGVAAGQNEYWSIWINDGYANCGISCQTLAAGDEIAFVRTAYDPETYAETQLDRLELTIGALSEAYKNVVVPDACSVADTSGATHSFSGLLGICALVAAASEGYVSAYELTNASFGLYLSGLNSVTLADDEYWALWLNGAYAQCGIACLPIEKGAILSFVRTTFSDVETDRVDLRVIGSSHVQTNTEGSDENTGGTGGTGDSAVSSFDTAKAFSYLVSLQEEDGTIENGLVTDWAAIAFSVSGAPSSAKSLLKQYLKNEAVDLDTPSDYIRHAMAMLALDVNPYTGGPEDYITPIVESFDGTQLGEDNYINDDIFSLFPLLHAGYSEEDQLIKDIVKFIVSQQAGDGSWHGIDLTAAAVQALEPVSSLPGVPAALEKAKTYLRGKQQANGGYGDPFATAWVIQAIASLGDSVETWTVGGNDPLEYLTSQQQTDGRVKTASGTQMDAAWATAYAITAAKGATWHSLLDNVRRQEPKPESEKAGTKKNEDNEGEVLGESDEVLPEPLVPAFTFEAPVAQAVAPTLARAATEDKAEPAEEEIDTEDASAQTAAAGDAAGGSWLMNLIASLWLGFVGFLKSLFS